MSAVDTIGSATDAAQTNYTIPKFCPLDGSILFKEYRPVWECECWVCPECGFEDPIL